MKDLGYVEGQNILVEYHFSEGRSDRMAEIIAELLQRPPDVIVALGANLVAALKNATTAIPVVMTAGDPVGSGYVASLARPGGNLTGISLMQGVEGLTAKRLELIKDAVQGASRVGFIFNRNIAAGVSGLAEARRVAGSLTFTIRPLPARSIAELEGGRSTPRAMESTLCRSRLTRHSSHFRRKLAAASY